MSRRDTHDVVGDAVDAITQGQEVQWERCSRLATPDERRVLETLRRLARLFAVGEAGRAWSTSSVAAGVPDAGGVGRRAVQVAGAVAATDLAGHDGG